MSFHNLLYHMVFPTYRRQHSIALAHEGLMYQKLHRTAAQLGVRILSAGGISDHIHLLISIPSDACVSKVAQTLKQTSSIYLKSIPQKFPKWDGWSEGYGAFTVSWTHKDAVDQYIRGQKEHHLSEAFVTEYKNWLIRNGVDPTSPYLPKEG